MMSKKRSFQNLLNSSDVPILVDFYADWCGPCHTLSPIVKDVASAMHGKLKVIKVDVDKNQRAAAHYGIRSIPTLILFHKGQIIWKKAGLMRRKDLIAALESSINKISRT